MDEWVDVLDKEGRGTGQRILKSEAHKRGVFHPTVHIWLFDSVGNVLLQQRSHTKETFPLLWDVSVAGHIAAGEGILQAALREIHEEIGLTVREKDLIPVGMFRSVQEHENGILDCEFHHTFICLLEKPVTALELQDEEVAQIGLFGLKEWEKDLFSDGGKIKYVPHDKVYYQEVIRAIRKHL